MRIAVISTAWFPLSHSDVIVSRWVRPLPTDLHYGWSRPSSRIASAFIEQTPTNDIGHAFCRSKGIPVFPTVREALTLGSERLGVDAVLLIGEHGDYPLNEYGQKLYPRKRLFDEIAAVFRECGTAVPVFNDKHLSYDFTHSQEMIATAAELGFPLYAGSSIPHCYTGATPLTAPGETITEALAVYYGDPDAYGYHSIEWAQSLVESRAGGETGIAAVRGLKGHEVCVALESGEIPTDLFIRSLRENGFPDMPDLAVFLLERTVDLTAFQLRHTDGLLVTHVLLKNIVVDWPASVRLASGEIRSASVPLVAAPHFYPNFARLNAAVEKFFLTGLPPTPLARTHLAAGALEAVQKALFHSPGTWVDTPELKKVTY